MEEQNKKNTPERSEEINIVMRNAKDFGVIPWELFEQRLLSVGGEPCNIDKYGFYRSIKIDSFGTEIIFQWWPNFCNAKIGEIEIHDFKSLEISGTWPNKYKTNILILKSHNPNNRQVMAIVPIDWVKRSGAG